MLESEIVNLSQQILSSRKNANKISQLIDLICINDTERPEVTAPLCAMENAVTVFTHLFENGDILFEKPTENPKTDLSSVIQYKLWIGEHFIDCLRNMLNCLTKVSISNQEQILTHIMELLRLKFSVIFSQNSNPNLKNYCQDIYALLNKLLLNNNSVELVQTFCSYVDYDDVRYVVLKGISATIKEFAKSNQISDQVLEYIFLVLKDIAAYMPDSEDNDSPNSFLLTKKVFAELIKLEKKPNLLLLEAQRNAFGGAWLEFLKQPLSASLHKEILIILHNLLIPNFSKPRLLADFLTRSFHQGGGLALLGLHGLFVLVNEYNLEYPDFYKNLYTLLHPRIFDKKYKNRFFNLLQRFLSSTHIPSYIVAAFVKKMSRLLLVAPPYGILVILNLISTLIHTHPSIAYLINNENLEEVSRDPFLEEEDLANCKAALSSLWEVAALKNHYLPEVAKAAAIVHKGKVYKHNVDKLLDSGYQDLIKFDEPIFKSNAMNHVPPTSFVGNYEDITAEFWTF